MVSNAAYRSMSLTCSCAETFIASDTSEQGDAFDDEEGYDAFDVTAGGQ